MRALAGARHGKNELTTHSLPHKMEHSANMLRRPTMAAHNLCSAASLPPDRRGRLRNGARPGRPPRQRPPLGMGSFRRIRRTARPPAPIPRRQGRRRTSPRPPPRLRVSACNLPAPAVRPPLGMGCFRHFPHAPASSSAPSSAAPPSASVSRSSRPCPPWGNGHPCQRLPWSASTRGNEAGPLVSRGPGASPLARPNRRGPISHGCPRRTRLSVRSGGVRRHR
jgi:hypothetical protein